MQLLYILLVLLLFTRLFGELAQRFKQPGLVGELISGLALGILATHYSDTLPVLAGLPQNEVFLAITDLAIFFLMLSAGIELRPRDLSQASGRAMGMALGGMLLPFALGAGIGWYILPESNLKLAQVLFLGTALAVTAVPVSVKVLMDLGKLDTRLGKSIVSAAVFDDIFSLFLLAILTAVISTGTLPGPVSIAQTAGKIALFFIIAVAAGRFVLPWIGRISRKFLADDFEFSALLITALAYSVLAELLDTHFILGAFLAGLFFVRRTITPKVFNDIRGKLMTFTTGLFAPLFFAYIGMNLDLGAAREIPWIVVALAIAAFVGKLAGAGLPAYFSGFSRRESFGIGLGMSARGAVELIIADIALRAGLFSQPDPSPPEVKYLFSAVVMVALLTTLITPIALRPVIAKVKK